ncbi:MAG TPA: hypothetical protein VG097_12210 [Gemmata sp.]|jgi:hypothetical protein|nr:hypothetical protein [Gemmata sp.]
MVNVKSKSPLRTGSLAAACGAAVVLAVVMATATTIVLPLPVNLPTGTDVSPADTAGVNLLEPAKTATGSEPKGNLASNESVERVVGEWTPTGGGSGGGGSPKH